MTVAANSFTNFQLCLEIKDFVNADLGDKVRHVRDEDHRTFIGIECLCDARQVAEVDVIGRLIEYEKPRLLEDEAGKCDESFLSLREVSDFCVDHVLCDEKPCCNGTIAFLIERFTGLIDDAYE